MSTTLQPGRRNHSGSLGRLLEGLTDGVVVFDADRRLVAFNSSLLDQFRLEPGVLRLGDDLETVVRAVAARGGLCASRPAEEAVQQRLDAWGTEADRRERRFLADGRGIDVVRSQTETGEVMAVHVDVTETLRRERALERQRVYMESLLENMADGAVLIDGEGHYIAFNQRFLELYRIDADKVYWGIHADDLAPQFGDLEGLPDTQKDAALAERRRFAQAEAREESVYRRLGDGRVLLLNRAPLPTGGSVITVRDTTAEMEREYELDAARRLAEIDSRRKSTMLARMSHEMRTPLNGVLGIAALLRRTRLDARQRELVDVISSSGEMLVRLIDDVLDFSRMQADGVELSNRPFDIALVARESVALLEPVAQGKGLALVTETPADPLPLLHGDPVRIKQVLLNLLGNAIKFTESGRVTVGVSVGGEAELRRCVLSVADTGIGIPETEREAVFGQFYQVDGSDTRHSGGAGLGLAISRLLVHAMGGSISAHANEPGGTVFEVVLPLPGVPKPGPADDGVGDSA